jgi:hypothetical protein
MSLQKSRCRIVVFAFVFALLAGGRMFASVTASISGTVKDASGASIAGATVTATDTGTGIYPNPHHQQSEFLLLSGAAPSQKCEGGLGQGLDR